MKYLFVLFLALFLFPALLNAKDNYEKVARPKWKQKFSFSNVRVKSLVKMPDDKKELIEERYDLVRAAFFVVYNVNPKRCSNGGLEIRIINEKVLNNKRYFPNETYANKNNIIFGRYYDYKNTLYTITPVKSRYWKENFAGELIHHFFNDCGCKFFDRQDERAAIEKFLNAYRED